VEAKSLNECPETGEYLSFIEGSSAGRENLESHLAHCRSCRERLIALYDQVEENRFLESAPMPVKVGAKSVPRSAKPVSSIGGLRPYIPLTLAAGIVLAVTVSIFVYRGTWSLYKTPEVADLRSEGAPAVLTLSSPPNGSTLAAGVVEFRWTDASAGARYEFTLTDDTGDIVSQQKSSSQSLELDTSLLGLAVTKKYYWSVVAVRADGTRIESVISGFTIR
jgi:hypothetical protein